MYCLAMGIIFGCKRSSSLRAPVARKLARQPTHSPHEVCMKPSLLFAFCIAAVACNAQAAAPNPYADHELREIKALSPEEVQSFLAGKGMGLAKAAELNGYPGPSHVLALAAELGLTAEQQTLTQSLFAAMEADASKFGRLLVEEERKLDQLFATRQVTPETLNTALSQIGVLQARVRAAHLEAHLAQVRILTPEQTVRYLELRGYSSPQPTPAEHHRHGGHG